MPPSRSNHTTRTQDPFSPIEQQPSGKQRSSRGFGGERNVTSPPHNLTPIKFRCKAKDKRLPNFLSGTVDDDPRKRGVPALLRGGPFLEGSPAKWTILLDGGDKSRSGGQIPTSVGPAMLGDRHVVRSRSDGIDTGVGCQRKEEKGRSGGKDKEDVQPRDHPERVLRQVSAPVVGVWERGCRESKASVVSECIRTATVSTRSGNDGKESH